MQTSDESSAPNEAPVASAASGCFYAMYVVGVSAVMLFVNALFCLTIYSAIPKGGNEQVVARFGQLFYFIAPMLLLIVEWNLLDRLLRLFARQTNS